MLRNIRTPARSLKVESSGASKLSGSKLCFLVKNAVSVARMMEKEIAMSAEETTERKKRVGEGSGRRRKEETP